MKRNQKIRVAAAVMVREGEVFLARRGPGRHLAGYWEFPGGKIEPGEIAEACLQRELFEEFSIQTTVDGHIHTYCFRYPNVEVEMNAFWVTPLPGELRLKDHDQMAWVKPESLSEFPLAPADVPLLGFIFKRFAR